MICAGYARHGAPQYAKGLSLATEEIGAMAYFSFGGRCDQGGNE
jgi:hypothetical protein